MFTNHIVLKSGTLGVCKQNTFRCSISVTLFSVLICDTFFAVYATISPVVYFASSMTVSSRDIRPSFCVLGCNTLKNEARYRLKLDQLFLLMIYYMTVKFLQHGTIALIQSLQTNGLWNLHFMGPQNMQKTNKDGRGDTCKYVNWRRKKSLKKAD